LYVDLCNIVNAKFYKSLKLWIFLTTYQNCSIKVNWTFASQNFYLNIWNLETKLIDLHLCVFFFAKLLHTWVQFFKQAPKQLKPLLNFMYLTFKRGGKNYKWNCFIQCCSQHISIHKLKKFEIILMKKNT